MKTIGNIGWSWILDSGCFWISLSVHYWISSIKYPASSIVPV